MTATPTDETLARNAACGDKAAFAELVRRHTRSVYAYCRRLLNDLNEAEDATQETFVKAYRNMAAFRREARFSSWLIRIARNTCIDILRARRAWVPLEQSAPLQDRSRLRDCPDEALAKAVAALPERERKILDCKYRLEMKAPEIATELKLSPGAVRTALHRAIARLRERLR